MKLAVFMTAVIIINGNIRYGNTISYFIVVNRASARPRWSFQQDYFILMRNSANKKMKEAHTGKNHFCSKLAINKRKSINQVK
jgi:hypothetical protein